MPPGPGLSCMGLLLVATAWVACRRLYANSSSLSACSLFNHASSLDLMIFCKHEPLLWHLQTVMYGTMTSVDAAHDMPKAVQSRHAELWAMHTVTHQDGKQLAGCACEQPLVLQTHDETDVGEF